MYASQSERRLLLKLGASGNDIRTTRERAAPSTKLTEFMRKDFIENTQHNILLHISLPDKKVCHFTNEDNESHSCLCTIFVYDRDI